MNDEMNCVYLLSNNSHSVFYIGRTFDLGKRLLEHRQKVVKGFSEKYNIKKLLYYEFVDGFENSLAREKVLKRYPRAWKINLVNAMNPSWRDLASDFLDT